MRADLNISHKANRILNLILLTFLLILIRVWYLGFVQQEYYQNQARKPQRKSVIQKMERATIRDRFNIPLSQNKIGYTATIRYADLREIPSHRWIKNTKGEKTKEPVRSRYIASLANVLAQELNMDAQAIEDIIYAKASLFPQTPFVIKENLSEKEYYRVRMLQKDWRGLEAERTSQRVYPLHKTACDVVGYLGAISSREYLKIAEEIKELQEYIKKREMGEIVFLPFGYDSPLEVRERLKFLQEKAYTINDQVGKMGVEGFCDEMLRGVHGKKLYEIDPKGNTLRELPGSKKGVSGQRVFLSISAELQQHAEELLAQHETFRDMKDKQGNPIPGLPWIKGGAIVALHPKTGEVLALASYPRFDPNDFISSSSPDLKKEKQQSINQWLENETHVGEIWDGKTSLKRETYSLNEKKWGEEIQVFNWEYFLNSILSPESSLRKAMSKLETVENAYFLLKQFEKVLEKVGVEEAFGVIQSLYFENPHIPGKRKCPKETLDLIQSRLIAAKEELHPSIQALNRFFSSILHNDDKLLALDLVRLLVFTNVLDDSLIQKIGHLTLFEFMELTKSLKKVHDQVRENAVHMHHNLGFKQWRESHFKAFLKQKRKEEKEQKKYAKPYTEYLEKIEKTLFKNFWNACKFVFLDAVIMQQKRVSVEGHDELTAYLEALVKLEDKSLLSDIARLRKVFSILSPEESIQCMKAMRGFEELNRPLYGRYRQLRNTKGVQLEKHLAGSFYPLTGFGYGRSQAFRQSTPQGSVFKIAIAYEALKERYEYLKANHLSLKDLNPLTIVDQIQTGPLWGSPKLLLGYTQEGEPIRRLYKGGVLPRTHPNIGKIDLPNAIEQSSNIYFSLLAAEHIADPSFLEKMTKEMGLGSKTGIDLPGEIGGTIPDDLADNKTGLYSFAIGQHSLIVTPLQTAVMYAAFANKGEILKPQIIHLTAGKKSLEDPFSLHAEGSFPFQDSLALAGVAFPLFTESLLPSYNPIIHKTEPEVRNTLFFPDEIRSLLLEGMDRVLTGQKGTAKPSIIRYLRTYPNVAQEYKKLQKQLLGKTGTAEIFHKQWLDSESKAEIRNHIWFAGFVFPEGKGYEVEWDEAELVIIVYLRFSQAGGKESAPLAAQMITKWREIQKKLGASSYFEAISSPGNENFSHF